MIVGDIIRITANRLPTNIGIVHGQVRLTWRQIDDRVNAFANALIDAGLQKGERVAILADNCHQYLEIYLALAKAGLVATPLNTWLKRRELQQMLSLAQPVAIVTDPANVAKVGEFEQPSIRLQIGIGAGHRLGLDYEDMVASASREEPKVAISEDDPFSFAFTSGTTGASKAAVISHRNSVVGSTSHAFAMSLRPHHTLLVLSPMFVFGSCANRFNAVIAGARIVISDTDAESILDAIERERITHMVVNPTVLQRLIAHPACKTRDVSSVEFIAGSGAPTPLPVVQDIISLFGNVWHVWYGATETVAGVFLLKEDWAGQGLSSPRLTSIGRAGPFLEVDVLSDAGKPVARDGASVGEIVCRGDSVCRGYYMDKQGTNSAFRDGWYCTGDLGTIDEDGYIFLAGRKKDLIISGAMNIYPKEIEDLLHSHEAVEICSVVGVPHPKWGETPKAFVRLRSGHSVTEEELINFCGANLASYKRPSSVEFVTSFPTNSMGKIVKRELRELHSQKNPTCVGE